MQESILLPVCLVGPREPQDPGADHWLASSGSHEEGVEAAFRTRPFGAGGGLSEPVDESIARLARHPCLGPGRFGVLGCPGHGFPTGAKRGGDTEKHEPGQASRKANLLRPAVPQPVVRHPRQPDLKASILPPSDRRAIQLRVEAAAVHFAFSRACSCWSRKPSSDFLAYSSGYSSTGNST